VIPVLFRSAATQTYVITPQLIVVGDSDAFIVSFSSLTRTVRFVGPANFTCYAFEGNTLIPESGLRESCV